MVTGRFTVDIMELGINITVETGLKPNANGKVKILYWDNAWINIFIPGSLFKSQIEDGLTKTLNDYLQMFITIDNNMNHYNKTLMYLS